MKMTAKYAEPVTTKVPGMLSDLAAEAAHNWPAFTVRAEVDEHGDIRPFLRLRLDAIRGLTVVDGCVRIALPQGLGEAAQVYSASTGDATLVVRDGEVSLIGERYTIEDRLDDSPR